MFAAAFARRLKRVLEWAGKHLSWRWVISAWCVAGFFLFLPKRYSASLGLFDFAQKNHVWLVVAFIGSGVFLLTYPVAGLYKAANESIQRKRFMRQGVERVQKLSPDEKVLFRRFVYAEGAVTNLDIMTGTVRILSSQGLIFQASHLGRLTGGFPYKINPGFWST
jgi:hypothetical protein